jgi:hypothetical protein
MSCAADTRSVLKGIGHTLLDFEEELDGIETGLNSLSHAIREMQKVRI